MRLCFKFGILLFLLSITAKCTKNKDFDKQKDKSIENYEKKQSYYQKTIQQYWYISPDTSLLFADSALAMAKRKNNLRDLSYFNLLKGIAFYYQGKNIEAIKTFNKSLDYKSAINDKFTASAYNMLSLVYRNLGKYDSAIYYSKKSLHIRKHYIKDSNDIAGSYDNLSTIYHKLGKCDSAIEYSLKAAKIFENIGNNRELAYTWGNLSSLYAEVNDKKNSYRFLKMAYDILKNEGNKGDYAELLENMGIYFLEYGSLDSAMIYFKEASQLYKKLERYDGYADSKKSLGEIYLKLNENDKAEQQLTEAYKQFEKSKRIRDIIETEVLLAEVEIRKSNYKKAEYYINEALSFEKNIHSDKIRLKILTEKEKLLEQSGKNKEALALFHEIRNLLEQIDKKELESKLEELSTKYQTERILSENKKLKQEREIQRMKAKEIRITFIVLVVVTILVVFILLLILQKRKKNILIQKQKLYIAKKEEALIKAELQNAELKKEELAKENNFRSRQLTTYTLHMMQKNIILQDVLKEIKVLENTSPEQIKKELVNLKIQLINAISTDTDWDNFKLFFEKVNPNFFTRLREKYPNISNKDEKLCSLIRLNMDINEAASVLNVDSNSVRVARYRLRKKMGLKPEDDLHEVIANI